MALPLAALATGAGGFLKNNWKPLLVLGVVLGLWWYVNSIKNERDHWHDEYVTSQQALALAEANITTLRSSIDEQNAAIERMNADLVKKDELLAAREEDRRKLEESFKKQLEEVLAEETPQTCQGTIDYLVDGVEELR